MDRVRGYSFCDLYFSYVINVVEYFERVEYLFFCSIKLFGDVILSECFLEIIENE